MNLTEVLNLCLLKGCIDYMYMLQKDTYICNVCL